jgi:hypothetical protein
MSLAMATEEPLNRKQLRRDITRVRTFGLGWSGLAYMSVLLKIARRISSQGTDRERVEEALLLAISDYGEPRDQDVARLWFGLDPSTRDRSLRERLEAAVERWEGQRAESTVRTKDGRRIVRFLADRLLDRYAKTDDPQPVPTQAPMAASIEQAMTNLPAIGGRTAPRLRRWLPRVGIGVTAVISAVLVVLIPHGHDAPPYKPRWGPPRPTFLWEKPATYDTFNSITDNPSLDKLPSQGDERRFLFLRVPNSHFFGYEAELITDGTITLMAFFENDVAPSIADFALHTRIGFHMSSRLSREQTITAYVNAGNAKPQTVWSDVRLEAENPFRVSYVKGSARLWNNAKVAPIWGTYDGIHLSNRIATPAGALLGCNNNLDGRVSGDVGNCSGWVTIQLRIRFV